MRVIRLASFFFTFFLLQSIYGGDVVSLSFIQDFLNGNIHIDTLFHVDIISMTNTYQIPSIGIDDIIYIKYHNFIHWHFAQWSKLLNCTSYEAYTYFSSMIVLPFFILSFFICIVELQFTFYKKVNLKLILLLFILLIVGLTPSEFSFSLKTGLVDMPLQSITMTMGGIFIFIFLCFFSKTLSDDSFFLFPYFFLSVVGILAKGTVIICLSPVLSIYLLLRKQYKKFFISVFLNVFVLVCYYVFFHSSYSIHKINLLSYLLYSADKGFLLYAFFIANGWIIVSIYAILRYREVESIINTNKLYVLIIILFYCALSNYVLVNIINFGHNAGFFIQNTRWIGIVFTISFIAPQINKYFTFHPFTLRLNTRNYVIFLVCFYLITNFFITTGRNGYTLVRSIITKNQKYKEQGEAYNKREEMLTFLNEISKIENKQDKLLLLRNKNFLKDLFPKLYDKGHTLLVPAITGIGLSEGISQDYFETHDAFFGYADYYNQVAKPNKNYKKEVLIVDFENLKIYSQKE